MVMILAMQGSKLLNILTTCLALFMKGDFFLYAKLMSCEKNGLRLQHIQTALGLALAARPILRKDEKTTALHSFSVHDLRIGYSCFWSWNEV